MNAQRKKHFAVDKLSPQARALIDEQLGRNATYDEIAAAVKKATGEKVAVSSLQRYRANAWFPTRRTLEETDRVYGQVKEFLESTRGKKLDEVSSELLKTHLFKALAAGQSGDPVDLYSLVISEGRLNVEKEKLALGKDKLKLEEQKVRALEKQVEIKERQLESARQKAMAAEKKVEEMGRKKKLDPATMRVIKEEIYGIVTPAA